MDKGASVVGYPTKLVAKITGASPSTLSNWYNSGLVVPEIEPSPGTGTPRLYSFADLVAIRACVTLIEGGFSRRALAPVVAHIRKRHGLSATKALGSTVLIVGRKKVSESPGDDALSTPFECGNSTLYAALSFDSVVSYVQTNAERVMREAA